MRHYVMTVTRALTLLFLPILFGSPTAAAPASHPVHFRSDDFRAQRIAKKLLAREIAQQADAPPQLQSLRTAWVNVSDARPAALFVMYGCSPTGNCDLYGYEPTKSGWRLVLNSIAQRCSILATSHGRRRDIRAFMHGSATETGIKTYWWRGDRYVRVSQRNVTYK